MSNIVELTNNIFEANHVLDIGPLERRILVPGSTVVFKINARREGKGVFCVLVTITAEDSLMKFAAVLDTRYNGETRRDVISDRRNTSDDLYGDKGWSFTGPMAIKVEFLNCNPLNIDCNRFLPDFGDIKSYIEGGSQVTMVGSDGSLTVPKRLLEMRSSALEMIFSHDSQEQKSGSIQLKDYDSKTLEAFVHFLMTAKIKDGKETALGLILLGDKYDIQFMKSEAERFVKSHFHELDRDEAMEIMLKVSRKTVEEDLLRAWRPK